MTIIKLWDNEKYDYPYLEIRDNSMEEFNKSLKKYKRQDDYNIDEFIALLEDERWFIRAIYYDEVVFF